MTPTEKKPVEGVPLSEPGAHGPPANLDYELIRMIGQGGYGEVWLVRESAGKFRACKVVYRESFQHDRPYDREYEGICKFVPVSQVNESQLKILHVGRRDQTGYFYYIMELADDVKAGQAVQPDSYVPKTLKSELEQRGRLPVAECLQIGLSLSAALENLHSHGLIHRDIKPANIVFVNGVPKLADIGLVTEADVTVSYVGTGGYIPPEGPSSPQADVYGLGKVLYEISTGKDRLEYPELPANFGELPDRSQLLELNAIISRACEARARKRYASARELHADLELLKNGRSIRRIRAAKRRWALVTQLALILCALGLMAAAVRFLIQDRQGKVENEQVENARAVVISTSKILLPDAAQVAREEESIKQVYHSQLLMGSATSKQEAAAELARQSTALQDPVKQLASLHVAMQLAMAAQDLSLAMEICQGMVDRFQMDILPAKVDMLTQASHYTQDAKKEAELSGLAVRTGFEAIAADDYDSGVKAAELAEKSAQDSGDARHVKEATFLNEEMARCQKDYGSVKQAKETLRSKPGDPAASLIVGKFLCFVKNDWEDGLPLMAAANDEVLQPVLTEEINRKPQTSEERKGLGDVWWKLAGQAPDAEKIYYQERARYWYLKGIASAKEPDRTQLRQQLAERIQTVPTRAGELVITSRISGTTFVDIYADEIQWKSGRGNVGSKINLVELGDLNAKDLRIIKNYGTTRLLPETVDFSTARMTVDHKPVRQSQARLETFDDHVRVVLTHSRPGAALLEVTVIFGNPSP